MEKLTEKQLLDFLINYKRCTPISIEIETPVKMRKTNNPYVGATCCKKINGMINFDYGNSINRQRDRENKQEDFNPYIRKWGVHITKSVIGHKGNYYLQLKLENSGLPTYYFEGNVISYDLLYPFINQNSYSSRQGVDKEIQVRDIKMCNIKTITIDKVQYVIR